MMTYVFYYIIRGKIENELEPRWQENVTIHYSNSEEEAYKLVREQCKDHEYINAEGELIKWELYKLNLIQVIEYPIPAGEDIFYRGLKTSEVESLETKFED